MLYRSLKDGTTDDKGKNLDGHVSDEEYLTYIKIWNKFNMKNMGDYHNHFLKKDVLSLDDGSEKFTSMCLKFYKLDPCHYFISCGLIWDVMLKMTEIKLEQISDIDMYLFVEKGLRGGNSYICKRFSEANNKNMKNNDPTKPSKYITYLNENNFYGWAMSGYFPYGESKQLKDVDNFNAN